ncbi:glycosyltransferase [Cellulophaga sp. E16_2]|uniref:glycosyltransferase n=1 Tax=Cellulophaga sp. E16_2 TaxID=2789297 RepID=UPI001A91346D|nr:glycosyltransferase [Cellulophaga sp. E16_2]MBO0590867.1 glycosyltransferase [Cellulophaga sp. E16_2]
MNILFLIDRYPGFGGIETVTTVLSNYFIKQCDQVAIISYRQEDAELLEKLNDNVRLYNFPNKEYKISSENENYLKTVIEDFKPDFLINQESYSNLFELVKTIKNNSSFKIITVEHNSPIARHKMLVNFLESEKLKFSIKSLIKKIGHPFLLKKSLWQEEKYHQKIYNLSDTYILLSKKFIPILKKIGNLKSLNKIQIIENPITVVAKEIDFKKKEKIILYVGRLDFLHKRVDRLLKIWKAIAKRTPEWKLVIVGDGPDKKNLENYVAAQNIVNISFEGAQKNVEAYYTKASILCMTSNVEGFPLVLAEAMTFGCVPIVYNSFESASDIIDDGINGLLITAFNESKFSEALLDLIQNTDQRVYMAKKAIEDCNRFSLDIVGAKWNQVLQQNRNSQQEQ